MRTMVTAVLLVLALSFQASAAEKFILFVNKADVEIKQIRLAHAGTKEWGENILTKYKLKPGEKIKISLPHDQGDCQWDLKYVVTDKWAYFINDIDICQAVEIDLFLKGKQAWANIK